MVHIGNTARKIRDELDKLSYIFDQGGTSRTDTDPWTGGGVIFYFFNGQNKVSIGY